MDLSLITYHFILPMLEFFRERCGSYGWAIIAVTALIKIGLYPLTKQQTASMQKLQALQPKIKIVQDRFNQQKEKYKDRQEKLKEAQEEFQKDMVEFYQKNKVNPMGGCFPMLIQLPILIALFWAFNGSPFKPTPISVPVEVLSSEKSVNEQMRGSSSPIIFVDKSGNKGRFVLNPGEIKIPQGKDITFMVLQLEGDLKGLPQGILWEISEKPYIGHHDNQIDKKIEAIADLKIDKNDSASLITKNPGHFYLNAILPASSENDEFLFINGLGKTGAINPKSGKINIDVVILVLLFGLTIWLSSKVSAGFSPPPSDPKQAELQKTMQSVMPLIVTVMTLLFPVPAGVLLYFVVSGFIQALQTWLVMRNPITLESLSSNAKA